MGLMIDIFSDVVCPWCYIGKRRLEKALSIAGDRINPRVAWLAFELNPAMPEEGMDRSVYLSAKFGSQEKLRELDERVSAAGAEEDIDFAFDRISLTPNTRDAHRMIWLSGRLGVQDAVVESLFRAYFCEAKDIGDRKVLVEIAEGAGFTPEDREMFLDKPETMAAVMEEEEVARHMGIRSVPSFIINRKYLVSGAHPPETLASAFTDAMKESDTGIGRV